MIEIRHLTKTFGKFTALKDVSLNCEAGQCIALIGPNGCGKTTLIKTILGMVIPTTGEVWFKGKNIARDFLYRQEIGYMPQIGRYPDNMTIGHVFEMIKDIRGFQGKPDEELFEAFGLHEIIRKRMGTLSGGTTQKVSASLAFLFDPGVLILDEPTAGLDPIAAELLKAKIIREHQRGKLVFVTSHMLSELDDMVTHVVMMNEGEIRFHLPVDKLKQNTGTNSLARAITHVLKHDYAQ